MTDNEAQAHQIAGVSSLPYNAALAALEQGGPAADAARGILEAEKKYAETNAKLAASKKKLAALIAA
jgi:hypothetical protein